MSSEGIFHDHAQVFYTVVSMPVSFPTYTYLLNTIEMPAGALTLSIGGLRVRANSFY